jgi:hypothetical protein
MKVRMIREGGRRKNLRNDSEELEEQQQQQGLQVEHKRSRSRKDFTDTKSVNNTMNAKFNVDG